MPVLKNWEIKREVRGGTAHWVHVTGPVSEYDESAADRKAGAEARKWAKESGMQSAHRISSGGDFGATQPGHFRHSVCYGFK